LPDSDYEPDTNDGGCVLFHGKFNSYDDDNTKEEEKVEDKRDMKDNAGNDDNNDRGPTA
jgi:hypothetical protein